MVLIALETTRDYPGLTKFTFHISWFGMYWRRQLPWIPPRITIRTWSTSLTYWKRIDNVGILADDGSRRWCLFLVLPRLKIDLWFRMKLRLIGGDWSLKYSEFKIKKTNSFESVAIPCSTEAVLYTHYVISCVCPRLLLRSNLKQPTARHELNEIGK